MEETAVGQHNLYVSLYEVDFERNKEIEIWAGTWYDFELTNQDGLDYTELSEACYMLVKHGACYLVSWPGSHRLEVRDVA